MSKEAQTSVAVTSPVLGLLGVAFVVLKLTGVIGWSWWWVLAPFWAPWALLLVLFTVATVVVLGRKVLR